MASKPKKRMKYPPGTKLADPLGFVLENLQPIGMAEDGQWVTNVRLKNHSAVDAFIKGEGSKGSLEYIVQMHNMTRALVLDGFGSDLTNIVLESDKAIRDIASRKQTKNTFTLYASEILALKNLLELHDAQLEVITTGELMHAHNRFMREKNGGKHHRLSLKPLEAA